MSVFIFRKACFLFEWIYLWKNRGTMATGSPFHALSLAKIPLDEHACIFQDELVVADNFEEGRQHHDLSVDPIMTSFLTSPYPYKVQFAIMHLCVAGSMRVRLNLTEYEMRRNSALIVMPGSIGQCMEVSADCQLLMIACANDFIVPEMQTEAALIVRKFLANRALLPLKEEQVEEVRSVYHLLRQKIRQVDVRFKREMLQGYLQILYYLLCQEMGAYVDRLDAQPGTRKKQIFDRFLQLLRQHYTAERSIAFYANEMCLTPKYLSQVVYGVSGRYAGQWIRDYVVLEAKALLKSGEYTVQQVSDRLNFANQSFFGSYFKKAVGCSPSAYQRL